MADSSELSLDKIRQTRDRLDGLVIETPVHHWRNTPLINSIGKHTEVFVKLELLQHTGTFKPRGALNNMLCLDSADLNRGVTAVSAGNHAIAVAFAAQSLGVSAKVVMTRSANLFRREKARQYGAELVLEDDIHQAFDRVKQIERDEGRHFVHPFEGPRTLQGTATAGLEFTRQVPKLDAMVLPIGGGGLAGGFAAALKQVWPTTTIYGVEPIGADSMSRSFAAGRPVTLDRVDTIADSLGAPMALPFSFASCRQFIDAVVLVEDMELKRAMAILFQELKLAVEPAAAATTAALLGPLRDRLAGRKVGIIACGSNISSENYFELMADPGLWAPA